MRASRVRNTPAPRIKAGGRATASRLCLISYKTGSAQTKLAAGAGTDWEKHVSATQPASNYWEKSPGQRRGARRDTDCSVSVANSPSLRSSQASGQQVDPSGRSGLSFMFPHRRSAHRPSIRRHRSFESAGLYLADNGSSAKVVNSILGGGSLIYTHKSSGVC